MQELKLPIGAAVFGKDSAADGGAIDFAVGHKNGIAPAGADGFANRGVLVDHDVSRAISIENAGAELDEQFGDGGFAAGNAAD